MQNRQLGLYGLVLGLIVIVVITALGGGLFNQSGTWQIQWQHRVFNHLCHQLPDRSFWLSGQPMAVCSRCLGIYTGFAGGWLLLPLWKIWNGPRIVDVKKLILAVLLINFIDIIGNFGGVWENTLISRLVLGGMVGVTVPMLFSGDFFQTKYKMSGKILWKN